MLLITDHVSFLVQGKESSQVLVQREAGLSFWFAIQLEDM